MVGNFHPNCALHFITNIQKLFLKPGKNLQILINNLGFFRKTSCTIWNKSTERESDTRFLNFRFFHESVSPGPKRICIPLGLFQIFSKIRGDICEWMSLVSKLFTGVNATGEQLSIRRRWLGCVGCLWTHLFMAVRVKVSADVSDFGGRRYRRFWFEVFWAASGASYQGVWGVYGCAFSWWFQWNHRQPHPTQVAEYCCLFIATSLFLPHGSQFCRKNRPLLSQQKKFFTGVVYNGQK